MSRAEVATAGLIFTPLAPGQLCARCQHTLEGVSLGQVSWWADQWTPVCCDNKKQTGKGRGGGEAKGKKEVKPSWDAILSKKNLSSFPLLNDLSLNNEIISLKTRFFIKN